MNDENFEFEIGTEENKFKIEMINNELFIDDIQIEDDQHSPLYSLVREVQRLRSKPIEVGNEQWNTDKNDPWK